MEAHQAASSANWDRRREEEQAARAWLAKSDWQCLMEEYAVYYGEWSRYWRSYKWQPLGGGHRALGDALAALRLLRYIAETPLLSEEDAKKPDAEATEARDMEPVETAV